MDKKLSNLSQLANALETTELSRRSLLKRAALTGAAFPVIASLLAACNGDDVDDEAPVVDEPDDDADAIVDEPDDDEDDVEPVEEPDDDEEEPVEESDDEEPDDEAPADVTDGGDVSVMYWGPQGGFSPFFGATGNTQQVVSMMFGTLVKLNDVLEPIPDLAESVEISDDAMDYTFELHQDVYFNDGEQLTSSDVRFTYETVIDPATGSYWGPRFRNIRGAQAYMDGEADSVDGIETPDDHTVILRMEEPSAVFLLAMTQFTGLGIAPEHVLADVPREDLEEHDFNWAPTVSAGALQFHEFLEDQYLELHRYEDYFRGAPAVDRIFVRDVAHDVGVAQLETGELDVMSLPVAEVERVEGMPHVNVEAVPGAGVSIFVINLTMERFQDVRVRQAMMYAVDRQAIVDSILDGYGEVIHHTLLSTEWFDASEEGNINPYDYDPDRARELLEEAGWDFDEPVEILVSTAAEPELERAITVLQEQWTQAGMETEVFYLEGPAISERIDAWDWEVRASWGGVFRADPHISAEYFHSREWSPEGNNYNHYSNERVDELFDRGREVVDLDERIQIYTEAAEILNEEVPWIHFYSADMLYGISTRLQGHSPASYFNNKFWDAHEWWVSE